MTSLHSDQEIICDALGRYLEKEWGSARRRAACSTAAGFDERLWEAFALDLGILGIGISEKEGGAGGTREDVSAVLQVLGAALAAEPYISTVLVGAGLLRASGTPEACRMLRQVLEGNVRIALAQGDSCARRSRLQQSRVTALAVQDGFSLSGRVNVVYGAPWSSLIIVSASLADDNEQTSNCLIASVGRAERGLALREYQTIDGGRAADLEMTEVRVGAPNILFGPGPEAGQALNAILDEATVGICAEALGVLRRLYDATVAYLRQRTQFGTPLAQFQVLRHQLVDMHIELTKSASITALADRRLDSPRRMREMMTSAAKWQVSRACRAVGEAAIQLHGAIGTTEELELGDYFKRALVISEQFGSEEFHRRRFQQLSFAAGD